MTCALKNGPRAWRRARWTLAVVAVFFSLACVGSGQLRTSGLNSPAPADDPLAAAAAFGTTGQVDMLEGPWGPGRAVFGEKYLSALGQTCRRAAFIAVTGQHRDLAVCQDGKGRWATAPDIFIPAGDRSRPL
ncbi:MAG: hypothetical protein LBC90_09190 [Candidatus Adiutrix sp.]|nr:hypothetical protein [Candidatus Adiutrix sp.]